jgi:hypothetical protein
MTSERLKEAVALARQGEKDAARRILAGIIRDDINNEMAWLWYADTMPAHDAKVQALRECLHHNPDSQAARRGLERLGAQLESAPLAMPADVGEEPTPAPVAQADLKTDIGVDLPSEPERSSAPESSPQTEPASAVPDPHRPTGAELGVEAQAVSGSPGIRLLAYLLAGLVGAIILGYVGLAVTGSPVLSLADLQDALASTLALIAALVGIAVGAAVGVLIVRAILTRPD